MRRGCLISLLAVAILYGFLVTVSGIGSKNFDEHCSELVMLGYGKALKPAWVISSTSGYLTEDQMSLANDLGIKPHVMLLEVYPLISVFPYERREAFFLIGSSSVVHQLPEELAHHKP